MESFEKLPHHRRRTALSIAGTIAAGASVALLCSCSAPVGQTASATTEAAEGQAPPASVASAQGWIAYQSVSQRGPDGIFLIRPDGSEDHEILLDVPGRRLHPDFSPDGTMLAFDQMDGGVDQTWVSAADGSDPRIVSDCDPSRCVQQWEPAWSPTGDRLAIATASADQPMHFGIAVVEVATGVVTQLVEHPSAEGQDHFPRWSPDGTTLVFWRGSATEDGGDTVIYRIGADGTGLTQLTAESLHAGDPDWAPDGTRILFGTDPLLQYPEAGHSELYTMAPDGSDQRTITAFGPDGPRATQPRWTPDGAAILYTRTTQDGQPRQLFAMAADGSDDGRIGGTNPVYTHPDLQPTP